MGHKPAVSAEEDGINVDNDAEALSDAPASRKDMIAGGREEPGGVCTQKNLPTVKIFFAFKRRRKSRRYIYAAASP